MAESTYSPLSRRARQLINLLKRTKDKGVQRAILQALAREIEKGKRAVVRRAKEAAERTKDRIKYGREFARKEARKASTRAKEPLMQQQAAAGKPRPKMTRDGYHRAAGLTPEQSRKVAAGPAPVRHRVRDRAAKVQAKLQSKARPVTVRNPAPRKPKIVHIGGGKPAPVVKPARAARPSSAPPAPARTSAQRPPTPARTPAHVPAAPTRTPVPLPSQTVARDHAARRAPRIRSPRPAVRPVRLRAPIRGR
jgi:hypothetical protein